MDAAEHDDRGAGLRGLARQAQRIADKIGYVLDFGTLVVMRENDRVALSSKLLDIRLKFGNELVPSMGRGSGGHAVNVIRQVGPEENVSVLQDARAPLRNNSNH